MRIRALISGLIIGGVLMGLLLALFFYLTAPSTYNVLVVGSDQRGTERARSDVLFVVSIPKQANKRPFFLSIPRDTKVEHKEFGLQKITHFYALGERPDDGKLLGNIDLTRSAVEQATGVSIDATVEVTFQSFQEIVNTLGGATLNGAAATGDQALAVIRDRFTEGRSDFSRQEDEREVLRSLLTKIKNKDRLQALQDYFSSNTQARLQYSKTTLIRFMIGAGISRRGAISIGEIEEASLPGQGARIYTPDFGKELYYWVLDEEATTQLIEEHF